MNIYDELPCPRALTSFDGSIVDVNSALVSLVGKSFDELVTTPLDDIMSIATKIFMQTHAWPMLLKAHKLEELFLKIVDSENNSAPVMASCSIVEHNAESVYCWVFYVAVERSNFERQLLDSRTQLESAHQALNNKNLELHAANVELERFTTSVSHDLRAPLFSINRFAIQLRDELAELLNDKQAHRFDRIILNAEHMMNLMDDLLRLSRMAQGDIEMTLIDVNGIIEEQLHCNEQLIHETKATIHLGAGITSVNANKALLGQCIGNLLNNALCYRNTARPLEINIFQEQTAQEIIIAIKDNGLGVPEEKQSQIFEMFEHLSPTTGTGVGLALVKTAMTKMDGSVSVLSSPQTHGSVFRLHFKK